MDGHNKFSNCFRNEKGQKNTEIQEVLWENSHVFVWSQSIKWATASIPQSEWSEKNERSSRKKDESPIFALKKGDKTSFAL